MEVLSDVTSAHGTTDILCDVLELYATYSAARYMKYYATYYVEYYVTYDATYYATYYQRTM